MGWASGGRQDSWSLLPFHPLKIPTNKSAPQVSSRISWCKTWGCWLSKDEAICVNLLEKTISALSETEGKQTCWAHWDTVGWTCPCQALQLKKSHHLPSSCLIQQREWNLPPELQQEIQSASSRARKGLGWVKREKKSQESINVSAFFKLSVKKLLVCTCSTSSKSANVYMTYCTLGFFKYRAPKPKDFKLILTKNEQLSNPIMMWVSSGMGVGPRLTSDISFSTCAKGRQMIRTDFHLCCIQLDTFPIINLSPR